MYELSKKKSLVVRIGYGIIGLLLLTALLKIIFKEPELTLDQELQEISNNINKRAPIQIDSLTKLINTQAIVGNKLQYNITINIHKENIDTAVLLNSSRQRIINTVKTDPRGEYFRTNKIDMIYRFTDKNGNYVCQILVPSSEYNSQ